MSNLRLKAIPASLAAIGFMTLGAGIANAADQAGAPSPGVYADGLIGGTVGYMVVTRHLYAPNATQAATATGGFIAVTLKPDQKAWGFALSDAYDNTLLTHTLVHTYSTGSSSCSVKYVTSYDPQGILSVAVGTATKVAGTITTSACKTAFSNQTGQPTSVLDGTTAKKSYTLIY